MGKGRTRADAVDHLNGIPRTRDAAFLAALAIGAGSLALQAIVFVLDGPTMSPDSAVYQSAAAHLLSGRGLVDFTGRTVSVFPPGTSLLLAAVHWLGAPWQLAWTLVGLASLAALLLATWRVLRLVSATSTQTLVLFGTVAAVAVGSGVFGAALSDGIFAAVAGWFTFAALRVLERPASTRQLVALGLLAGIAVGVRYVGVYLALTAVVTAALSTRRLMSTLTTVAAAAVIPLVVVGLNLLWTGAATGDRLPASTSVFANFSDALSALQQIPVGPQGPAGWGSLAIGFGALSIWLLRRHGSPSEVSLWLGLFVIGMVTFTAITASLAPIDRLSVRFLLPVAPPAAALIGSMLQPVPRTRRGMAGMSLGLTAALLVVAGSVIAVDRRSDPSGDLWRSKRIASALQARSGDGAIVHSNSPYLVWFYTGNDSFWLPSESAYQSPARPEELERFEAYLTCSGAVDLMWVGDAYSAGTYPPETYGLPSLPFEGVRVIESGGLRSSDCDLPSSFGTGTGQR